ncbi:MAG: hypothetical protein WCO60_12250 [Verrucomicrobiota bacterium]
MNSPVRVGLSEFWKLLSQYEDATIQEAVALSQFQFQKLERLGEFKASLLSRMEELAKKIGIDRRDKDLRARLEALERAEIMNSESAGAMLVQMKTESTEIQVACRRLASLRGAYASDVAQSGFLGEG